MSDCLFCKIIKGELPSFKIYENDKVLAFLDLSHFVDGHTIVIPKVHFEYVWDIDYPTEYYTALQKIANHYRNNLGYQFVDSMTLGRKVPHAHTHLIPHNGDNQEWRDSLKKLGAMQVDPFRKLSKEDGLLILERFKIRN